MIKVVVFDLDDTLIAESDFALSAFGEIALFLVNIINDTLENIKESLLKIYNRDKKKVFDDLFHEYNLTLDADLKIKLIDIYRNHYPNIELSDRVRNILNVLRKNNIAMGIITDGFKVSQNNKINALKLKNYIDFIVVTDEYGSDYWKPNQKAFKMVKDHFNVDFHEIAYIGDNIRKDFIAPNQLGMISILLRSDNGVYSNMQTDEDVQKPQILIKDISDLIKFI